MSDTGLCGEPRLTEELQAEGRDEPEVPAQSSGDATSQMPEKPTEPRNWFFKTRMCQYFTGGRCRRGTKCSFAHSEDELRQRPDLRYTKLCPAFWVGACSAGRSCPFAHDPGEVRSGLKKVKQAPAPAEADHAGSPCSGATVNSDSFQPQQAALETTASGSLLPEGGHLGCPSAGEPHTAGPAEAPPAPRFAGSAHPCAAAPQLAQWSHPAPGPLAALGFTSSREALLAAAGAEPAPSPGVLRAQLAALRALAGGRASAEAARLCCEDPDGAWALLCELNGEVAWLQGHMWGTDDAAGAGAISPAPAIKDAALLTL
mmetsp:Transcript_78651/g.217449  ORF Transcript_78651/g.217449 Transcript_78651/m.217449 type:complete len:316 (-) Transcript_78651:157-1104(-)